MHTNRDKNCSASFGASNAVLLQQEQGTKRMKKLKRVWGIGLEVPWHDLKREKKTNHRTKLE